MMKKMSAKKYRNWIFCLVTCVLCIVLCQIKTGYESEQPANSSREQVEILSVDNSMLAELGIVNSGVQYCEVRVKTGPYAGTQIRGSNIQNADISKDKVFVAGDTAWAMLHIENGAVSSVRLIDHYRIGTELILIGLFGVMLIIFGGVTGCGALISLVLSVIVIWQVMIPLTLSGYPTIWVALGIVLFLTAMIDILVAGFSRITLVAISGSLLGTGLTCILSVAFGNWLKIDGTSLTYVVPILSQSSMQLNIRDLFLSMVFLANSGALMDLSMDIASACWEIRIHKDDITRRQMLKSGFAVGKNVIGTMTTTLILAYSGSYLSMMMYFVGQGTPVIDLFNLKYVASEILNTLVGSFGLVTVAPFTAVVACLMMTDKKHRAKVSSLPEEAQRALD
ncbi:MAG: YibE/F family protein [Clostridia bacterium]|nr:YibE/F family protein [Clostridia bacterium]